MTTHEDNLAKPAQLLANGIEPSRLASHVVLGGIAAAGCLFIFWLRPGVGLVHGLTIALGYLSLIFIVASLVIGPLKLIGRRRNPVNIDLRRDVGIWAAITGCLHVYFGFQIHVGGQILLYFFMPSDGHAFMPQLNLFGLSNYTGAVATLLLVVLLIVSNDVALRKLKGLKWKLLQRSNYVVFGLVVIHMLGYQAVVLRDTVIRDLSYVIVLVALLAQALGIALWSHRAARRRAHRL